MKTLREFAEDVLNQVTTGTGYLGEIVEKAENNGKITVCISIRKSGSMVGPMIKLEGYYEEYKESQNEETLYGISREIETIANKAWEQVSERRRKSEPIEEYSVDSLFRSGDHVSSEF